MKCRMGWVALLSLVLAGSVAAQTQFGETNVSMEGSLGFGYGSSFGDSGTSSHNTMINGTGNLRGYYYNPNFISFDVQPFVNRSQDNSNSSSINNNSGVLASASFFAGSRFPGTFSYSRDLDSTRVFGLGNEQGYAGHGTGQAWTVGWSALLPKWPTLVANFSSGSQLSSIYGVDGEYGSNTRTLSLTSNYDWKGFGLRGTFLKSNAGFDSPSFLSSALPTQSVASANAATFSVTHRLPWHGNFYLNSTRYHNGSETSSGENLNTSHVYSTNATFIPDRHISFSIGGTYNDNLSGILNQALISEGGAPIASLSNGMNSESGFGSVGVAIARGLSVTATSTHTTQHWAGASTSSNQFSGSVNYNFGRGFLRSFTVSAGVIDTASQLGNTGIGLFGNLGFSRRFGAWDTRGSFSYTQSVQTLFGVLPTSVYNYSGGVGRRIFGRDSITATFFGSKTGLQVTQGSSHSETTSATFASRHFSVNGSWGEASGLSVLTSKGLVSGTSNVPLDLLTPDMIVVFNGSNYGASGNLTLVRRMEVTMNYNHSTNSTVSGLKSTFGTTGMLNGRLRYPMRKLYFDAGYSRISQLIASTSNQTTFTTYYFGISRWFSFF